MSDPAIKSEPSLQLDPVSTAAPMPSLETLGCLAPHSRYAVIVAWLTSTKPDSLPHLVLVTRDHEIEARDFLVAHAVAWTEIHPIEVIQLSVSEQPSLPFPSHRSSDECITQASQTIEPSRPKTDQSLQLDSLQNSINLVATLESLISSPRIGSKERLRQRCHALEKQGVLRIPGTDVVVIQTAPDSAPSGEATPNYSPANHSAYVAMAVENLENPEGSNPEANTQSAISNALRRLVSSGATPTHIQFLQSTHTSSSWDQTSTLQENVPGQADACFHFNIRPTAGVAPNHHPNSLVAFGTVEESQHITTPWFKDDGDIIMLIGRPIDLEDPLQGLGGSAWLQVIHPLQIGQRPRCHLVEAQCLHEAVRSLIYGGAVKSACSCDDGGLAVRIAECCLGPSPEADTPRLLGAELDLTVLNSSKDTSSTTKTLMDAWLFGESQNRIVITTSALDAGKILAQTKILGVPGVVIGRVGGSQLRIKSAQSEESWDLQRLHDLRREAAAH